MVSLDPLLEEIGTLRKAVSGLEKKTNVKQGPEDVYVTNQDEIKLHLRAELERFGRGLKALIESAKLPSLNISETIKLSNIGELQKALDSLKSVADALEAKIGKINFEPKLTVNANVPDVIVPDIKVPDVIVPKIEVPTIHVPPAIVDIDLRELLSALEPLTLLSRDPESPISVRISDGQEWLKEMTETIRRGNDQLATVVSTSYGLTKDEFKAAVGELGYNRTGYSGVKALTGTSAVQLSATSVPCKEVHLTVTSGPVACGFSDSVLATSGSEYGVMLYPANSPYIIKTDNLNRIYVAGANGRRVCYNYFA